MYVSDVDDIHRVEITPGVIAVVVQLTKRLRSPVLAQKAFITRRITSMHSHSHVLNALCVSLNWSNRPIFIGNLGLLGVYFGRLIGNAYTLVITYHHVSGSVSTYACSDY